MIPFSIDSKPPGAQVDVNGVTMGVTPTNIQLECMRYWVGVGVAPGGWAYNSTEYEITVYPSIDNPGISQTKMISACDAREMDNPGITFDLGLDTIAPRQRLDVNIDSDDGNETASRELEDTLMILSDLHNRGVLTDAEYQAKRSEVITNFEPD